MTSCRNCRNSSDCWIKKAVNFQLPFSYYNNKEDLKVVTAASLGECPVWMGKE